MENRFGWSWSAWKYAFKGVLENKDRYQVAGLCDLDIKKTNILKEKYKLSVPVYEDAETMLRECKPEVLIFVTHPDVRLEMVKLAAKYQVQAVSMEKPMAQSLAEACEIKKICEENHMKAVVCHQQKYLKQMQEMKRRIVAGEIGEIKNTCGNTAMDGAAWYPLCRLCLMGSWRAKSKMGDWTRPWKSRAGGFPSFS